MALLAAGALVLMAASNALSLHALDPLASGAMNGGGWVAFTFSTEGGEVFATMEATGEGPLQPFAVVYEDGLEDPRVMAFGSDGPGHEEFVGVRARHPRLGGVDTDASLWGQEPSGRALFLMNMGNEIQVGTFTVVLAAAGEIRTSTYEIQGSEDVAILGIETGPTFYAGIDDMNSETYAAARYGPGAGVAVGDAGFTAHIEHHLVGWFQTYVDDSPNRLTASTPDGPRECNCLFGDASWGPGRYEFSIGPATAHAVGAPLLVGADVRFPDAFLSSL